VTFFGVTAWNEIFAVMFVNFVDFPAIRENKLSIVNRTKIELNLTYSPRLICDWFSNGTKPNRTRSLE